MTIISIIQAGAAAAIKACYGSEVGLDALSISSTRKEFEGDYTLVTFPFTKLAGKKPEEVGEEIGQYLVREVPEIVRFNVVKGFLNLVVGDAYWHAFLSGMHHNEDYGLHAPNGQKVMVEYASPNTNKPLHLGHIRNILLGWSSYKILQAAGYEVTRVQVINDRGIAICKSMLAWQKFGEGATPSTTGTKSDHFVGDYYVHFERAFQAEYRAWQATPEAAALLAAQQKEGQDEAAFFKAYKDTYFNQHSALGAEAREMLLRWEANDPDTLALWRQMNQWVYDGFDTTYQRLGVVFDKNYYESETYLLGKDMVSKGLESGSFYQKPDGSVWIDLEAAKLDHKALLRSDGTSLYVTQDLGTAHLRYRDFGVNKMVYVVADEQNYHFKVLFEVLKRLGEPYADGLYHLAYGMVDLPTGKMKSREGTVVDADDLMDEVEEAVRLNSRERDTTADLTPAEQEIIVRQIALAALKFFIIKVHPQKRMIFDPQESVDLQGQTGPYVQNAYVRIQSVLRKAGQRDLSAAASYTSLQEQEKSLILRIYEFPALISTAAAEYDPSAIASYCYDVAKAYHRFYHDYSILSAESEAAGAFRLMLSTATGHVLRRGMDLLGIEMPAKM